MSKQKRIWREGGMNDEKEGPRKAVSLIGIEPAKPGISSRDFNRGWQIPVKYGNCIAGNVAARFPKDCGNIRRGPGQKFSRLKIS